jgi:hypothetical protein
MATWLLTCRHTFEQTLLAEMRHLQIPLRQGRELAPGLVRCDLPDGFPLADCNPAYALQILPNAAEIFAPSIRALAEPIAERLRAQLDGTTGAWDIHALVPGQLKGNPKPPMRRRADLVRDAVLAGLPRWALKRRVANGRQVQFLAQFILLDEGQMWFALSPVAPLLLGATWPATLPAGLADVPDDDVAPASSYRKLVEAFACLDAAPQPCDVCVDLGACPGGWTRVLLQHGAQVTAVDRAPLAQHLMADERVTFLPADAFAYRPDAQIAWLVSDIIAFPERVGELLAAWLPERLCRHFVVQIKFKGDPDWPAVDAARAVAVAAGYDVLARHFFNDKNELTLMGTQGGLK